MTKRIVFLGGTCAKGTTWREQLIPELSIDHFNPVVKNWNDEAYQNELKHREDDDFVLYTITPYMKGVYSIAEAVDDSNKRPEKTIFCVLEYDGGRKFPKGVLKGLRRVGMMVEKNGGKYFTRLEQVADYLNNSM